MLQNNVLSQVILLILIDIYIYTSIHRTTNKFKPSLRNAVRIAMGGMTLLAISAVVWYNMYEPYYKALSIRQWIIVTVMVIYGSKLLTILIIFLDDIQINTRRFVAYLRKR